MTVELSFEDDGVAVVALDRPDKLNIYNLQMRDDLIEAFAAVRDHPDTRAMLLRANGRHFSAGADLKEFGTASDSFDARKIRWERDPWIALWELPQPTVVALHGYAIGSGLEMSLLCDFRCAAPDARLGLPETRLAMIPAAGGTQSLARVIGPSRALPPILLADTIDAQRALQLGIVDEVADDVESAARAAASRLARLPTRAARAATRALRPSLDVPLDEGLRAERLLAVSAAASAN